MPFIKSILIRPSRKVDPVYVERVNISTQGIEGDHYDKADGSRQVTIIAADGLAEVCATVGFQGDAHVACRRNILVDTLPAGVLKGKMISVGSEVLLEVTSYCTPCFRMDENFGKGAIAAFQNRAGWTARIIQGGWISAGDPVFLK